MKILTFFSDSIHLLIAITEDPVRSLRAPMASLMISIVAIVDETDRERSSEFFFVSLGK